MKVQHRSSARALARTLLGVLGDRPYGPYGHNVYEVTDEASLAIGTSVVTLDHGISLVRTVRAPGSMRYHRWRVYGDEAVAGALADVWLAKATRVLTVAHDALLVAQYAVTCAPIQTEPDAKAATTSRANRGTKAGRKSATKQQAQRGARRVQESGDLRTGK